MSIRNLDKIFRPESIAVIGASERPTSVGFTVLRNLTDGFQGDVFPVNPKHSSVQDRRCYAGIGDLPSSPDLAVVCTPAKTVPEIVGQCGEAGILGLLILSAGFQEAGEEGRTLRQQLEEQAGRFGGLRILGPNCLGFICPSRGLNASFAAATPEAGEIAFISQSGALCTAILDWSLQRRIGFSYFVSVGNMLDVSFADVIDYLGEQEDTKGTVLYAESIEKGREFMLAARSFARGNPIIAYKAGRFASSAKAATSHTGAMAGEDDVFTAAFKRAGIERVFETEDMFDCALLLSRHRRPCRGQLAIVTNAGGPGVMASDALLAEGGELAELGDETIGRLDEVLPSGWSRGNPVDILGDAEPERFAEAVLRLLSNPAVDAVLVVLTPQAMTDPSETARRLADAAKDSDKPILGAWMGGRNVAEGTRILTEAGATVYDTPEDAIKAYMHLTSYARNLEALYETPKELSLDFELDRERRRQRVREILDQGSECLLEREAKALLQLYEIPVTVPHVARNGDEAVQAAGEIGYPVVMKIVSEEITHKSDIGGVALNLRDADDVRTAYDGIVDAAKDHVSEGAIDGVAVQAQVDASSGIELILGTASDPTFGSTVMIGTGGTMAEILHDRVIELPPLNERLARRMLESLRSWPILQGQRGQPGVDVDRVIEALVRLSYLVVEQPAIQELDINPLLAKPDGVIALDARAVVDPANLGTSVPPFPHLAIRPCPEHITRSFTLDDGTQVTLRPIRPEDEPLWHDLLSRCSKETIRKRFLKLFDESTHEMAVRYCYIDYDRETAIVAEVNGSEGRKLIGVARLVADPDQQAAEFAILVADAWQGKGLGTHLTDYSIRIGEQWGLQRIIAETALANSRMVAVLRECGFETREAEDGELTAVKQLG